MPDTTKLAQQLADQKARLQQQKETLARQQRALDTRLAALTQQRRQARLMQVGKLVEGAGLLWVEDTVLAQALGRVAETLKDVAVAETMSRT
jgi:multidrug efflux pump subunit AcrA (membrane-fusion protein)